MSELGRVETKKSLGCPSCRQLLDLKSCQNLSEGKLFRCPHCSQKLLLPQPGGASPDPGTEQGSITFAAQLTCPSCSSTLTPLTIATDYEVYLDHCSSCGGLWFDYLEVEEILHDAKLCSKLRLPKPARAAESLNKVRNCPRCSNSRLELKKIDEVEVDECPICKGRWLDAGEILQLAHLENDDDSTSAAESESEGSPQARPSKLWSFLKRLTRAQ